MSFYGVQAVGNIYHNGVSAPAAGHSPPATIMENLLYATPDGPGEVMMMASLVCEILFDSVLSELFRYLEYGNDSPTASPPMLGEVNIGECLTSVHAAQLPGSFLSSKCVGMVGIPYDLDGLAGDLNLAGDFSGFTVLGESRSSRDAESDVDFAPGVHMLGHAAVLLCDGWSYG